MSFIRTVRGDIHPSALGVCYAHEHVIIDPCYMTEKHPDFCIDSVDRAVEELLRFKQDGGDAMVDSMPTGVATPESLPRSQFAPVFISFAQQAFILPSIILQDIGWNAQMLLGAQRSSAMRLR